jgi:hypothetical protein
MGAEDAHCAYNSLTKIKPCLNSLGAKQRKSPAECKAGNDHPGTTFRIMVACQSGKYDCYYDGFPIHTKPEGTIVEIAMVG